MTSVLLFPYLRQLVTRAAGLAQDHRRQFTPVGRQLARFAPPATQDIKISLIQAIPLLDVEPVEHAHRPHYKKMAVLVCTRERGHRENRA